jgi:hypothetical protein
MRETNKVVRELESLAWSNGCITDRYPKNLHAVMAYLPMNGFGYITIPQEESKKKNFGARIAHEVGHYFFEEKLPPIAQELISVAYKYNNGKVMMNIERHAWSEARYILYSLGHYKGEVKEIFKEAEKYYLNSYKKALKG